MSAVHRVDRRALRDALLAARDAARAELVKWRAPLVLGRLHLCCNCAKFHISSNVTGTCELHGEGLAPFLPFPCGDFTPASRAALPEFLPSAKADAPRICAPVRGDLPVNHPRSLPMSKPDPNDIAQQFKNASRLDPTGQPRTTSPIPDKAGGSPINPGRPSPVGGPPTGERFGGWTDRQVQPSELPQSPSSRTRVGGAANPPKAR